MTTKVKVTLKKEGKREVSKDFELHGKELAAVLLRANSTANRTEVQATAAAMEDNHRLANGEELKRTTRDGTLIRFSPEKPA